MGRRDAMSMDPQVLAKAMIGAGLGPVTGVPDSTLSPLHAALLQTGTTYVPATSEGECMALAGGWALAGKYPVVLTQNSGLGNTVNPLSSLQQIFGLPCFLVVGWRGQPGSGPDAVEHEIMGQKTLALLETLDVPYSVLPADEEAAARTICELSDRMQADMTTVALVVPRGALSRPDPAPEDDPSGLTMRTTIEALCSVMPEDALVVSTTGFASRHLYELRDRPGNFYVVGSMGCAAGIGLGLALARTDRKVMVIDGDGALLMKMGTIATIGHCAPSNLVHAILDNEVYASTGGQHCTSATVDFDALGKAAGYATAVTVETPAEIAGALGRPELYSTGPHMVHVSVAATERPDRRPELSVTELRDRFMAQTTQ